MLREGLRPPPIPPSLPEFDLNQVMLGGQERVPNTGARGLDCDISLHKGLKTQVCGQERPLLGLQ